MSEPTVFVLWVLALAAVATTVVIIVLGALAWIADLVLWAAHKRRIR